jgi:hypothetical protein
MCEKNKIKQFLIWGKMEKKTPYFLKFYIKNTLLQAENPCFKIVSLR